MVDWDKPRWMGAAMNKPQPVPLAIRVYPVPQGESKSHKKRRIAKRRRPRCMFVFDTEARIDATQALTFGSYRFYEEGRCLEEGLFHANALSHQELTTLQEYAKTHAADTDRRLGVPELRFLPMREFLEKLYTAVYDARALLVGFNLPFDISRIAASSGAARGRFNGGFSFRLWQYLDSKGQWKENHHRPRVVIKHIDSKRALKGFTAAKDPDDEDRIPEESESGEPKAGYGFRGHFLDLRTLAFALTDRPHSLESACTALGVLHGKLQTEEHGRVTPSYIDYNRRDVEATSELAFKLLEEFDRHPIALQETDAYSPASIGKSYLDAMGIRPIIERQPKFSKRYLGYAQSAFYGGRASAHIRKHAVPVVYCDFLSMYPTVNALMGLWKFVIAKEIKVTNVGITEIERFLRAVSFKSVFDSKMWSELTAFVRVIADADILPNRARYNRETHDWQVAVNHLYAQSTDPKDGLWYALPDVVASILLTGKIPKIVEAFRIEAHGIIPNLKPTKLRGSIDIDPRNQDFFQAVIEERKRSAKRSDLSAQELATRDQSLKVLANATSYGIFAQMDPQEATEDQLITCYGIDAKSYQCRVAHPEAPGAYCFPPLASLITAAARLMLALLERCVTDLGGTYAMEDTDSMAIVATKRGGLVACPGGPYRTSAGQEAIRALSWAQVDAILKRFQSLKPYDPRAIPGSILEIEDDNFDPKTGKQRQLWCLAISAKRYALFLRDRAGEPTLLREGVNNDSDKWSEHGLGHLLNPTDPVAQDRWIGAAWLNMIHRSLALPTKPLGFEKRIAVGRITVSSPAVLRPLQALNAGKSYARQIKPFNFIVTCHVKALGHPIDADPERFHLIAPYENKARQWDSLPWVDQYTGKKYSVITTGAHGTRTTARVKSYGDVLREYEFHAESKCADSYGGAATKQTVGLLARCHIVIGQIHYIGKESNALEEVEEGAALERESPYTEYPDLRRDEWTKKVLPVLRAMPLSELQSLSALSRATLQAIRAGRRPHAVNATLLQDLIGSQCVRVHGVVENQKVQRMKQKVRKRSVKTTPAKPQKQGQVQF